MLIISYMRLERMLHENTDSTTVPDFVCCNDNITTTTGTMEAFSTSETTALCSHINCEDEDCLDEENCEDDSDSQPVPAANIQWIRPLYAERFLYDSTQQSGT